MQVCEPFLLLDKFLNHSQTALKVEPRVVLRKTKKGYDCVSQPFTKSPKAHAFYLLITSPIVIALCLSV
jgi:hypothetical protein